ncbi:hypothetical protein HK097_002780 [Rhizophlyctis rosea]|uniref:Uncharacterized protein n=1 Tax=Rhizophlyctis rosea TaxID=64517 RepID=A0AAD5SMP7_9FUNG|nr:hypothetical protein HK097_002780 [Rhizophlyctis rosea]
MAAPAQRKHHPPNPSHSNISPPTLLPSPTALPLLNTALLVFLRYGLIFATDIPAILANRVEASTPVTSFKRLQEGLYLFRHGITPYDGSIYYQAPLLLPIFHFIPPFLHSTIFILLDIAVAYFLLQIAIYKSSCDTQEVWPKPVIVETKVVQGEALEGDDDVRKETEKAEEKNEPHVVEGDYDPKRDPTRPDDSSTRLSPHTIATLYLLNPYAIIACLAKSTQLFSSLGAVMGIYFATRGKLPPAMLCLAVATYLSFYPLVLLAPVALLLSDTRKTSVLNITTTSIPLFTVYLGGLLGVSYLLAGSWQFLSSTYGAILFVPDLTPNIGLFWYFFIEMFDHYRTFFLCVFQIFVFVFVVPISVKFRSHPLFVASLLMAIVAIFKSYPSVADTSIYTSLFLMHSELFKYMRNTYLAINGMVYASVLGPLFHHLWLYAGSGNANFFFAITLVWAMAQVFGILDACYAMQRREWDRRWPGLRVARVEVVHK